MYMPDDTQYHLEVLNKHGGFIPVETGSYDECKELADARLPHETGYRICLTDRKRLKNGQLSLRGLGTRKYRPPYNYSTTLDQYIDWLRTNNKTKAYVFPETAPLPGNYEIRRTLKALRFELIEVPLNDYI